MQPLCSNLPHLLRLLGAACRAYGRVSLVRWRTRGRARARSRCSKRVCGWGAALRRVQSRRVPGSKTAFSWPWPRVERRDGAAPEGRGSPRRVAWELVAGAWRCLDILSTLMVGGTRARCIRLAVPIQGGGVGGWAAPSSAGDLAGYGPGEGAECVAHPPRSGASAIGAAAVADTKRALHRKDGTRGGPGGPAAASGWMRSGADATPSDEVQHGSWDSGSSKMDEAREQAGGSWEGNNAWSGRNWGWAACGGQSGVEAAPSAQ